MDTASRTPKPVSEPPRGQPTGARQDADALARWHQDLKRSGFAVLAAFGEAHPADFNRAAQGQGRQVPHGAGGFRLGVESDVLILQHQDCPDPRAAAARLAVLLDKAIQQLALQRNQARVAQSILHLLERDRPGGQGRAGLGGLPKNGVLQHRQKILNVREARHLHLVAHGNGLNLAALDAQAARIVLQE
jgi:hypothetical protein